MKHLYVLGVSLLLVVLLILWIGPSNILQALESANWYLVLCALLIHLIVIAIRAFRWGFIINKPWDLKDNYIVKTIGLFAGNFSPVRTAGEPVTALAGAKINHIPISEGLSAGLTERFFDLMIVGLLLIMACLFVPKIRILAFIGAFLSLGVVVLIYILNWRENSAVWLYQKIHPLLEKLPINEDIVDNFYHNAVDALQGMVKYAHSFSSTANISIVFILSATCWLLECIRLLTVFYAFNVKIGLLAVIIIFLLANIIGVVTALPGGIGSIEISLTGLFVIFGVPEALAGSIALVDRLVSFWAVTILGLIFSAFYAQDILEEVKSYTIDLNKTKKS